MAKTKPTAAETPKQEIITPEDVGTMPTALIKPPSLLVAAPIDPGAAAFLDGMGH